MHRLKKYPNRRLYDTTDSRYVTIGDLRRLIIAGESIKVEDSRDGGDLTRSVLMQILAEQEAEGHEPVLTNRALEQIIRFYGDRLGSLASRYIEQSILALLEHQDQFRARMRQLSDLSPLAMMRQTLDGPTAKKTAAPADKPASAPPEGSANAKQP